jgi:hypothetical protein
MFANKILLSPRVLSKSVKVEIYKGVILLVIYVCVCVCEIEIESEDELSSGMLRRVIS